MKKIIVTGGSGFIGSELIKYLVKKYKKISILSIDNYLSGSVSNEIEHENVKYVKNSTVNIFEYIHFKPDYLFHFGEYSRIATSFQEPIIAFESNLHGTFKVVDFCRIAKCKLIYSGSSAIFGNNGQDQHLSPYAWSKAKNIEMIKNYHNWFDLEYKIVYFYNVYGNAQISRGKYSTVVGKFIDLYKRGLPFTVNCPGTQTRDFTHIDDTIKGIVLAAFKGKNTEEYMICNGDQYSIIDLVELFDHEYTYIPPVKGDRVKSTGDSTKIKNLGWKPEYTLKKYIEDVINNIQLNTN